jgi:hypothetical protein
MTPRRRCDLSETKSARVEAIVLDALFRDGEIVDGKPCVEPVKGEGVTRTFGFHPDRLEPSRRRDCGVAGGLPRRVLFGRWRRLVIPELSARRRTASSGPAFTPSWSNCWRSAQRHGR